MFGIGSPCISRLAGVSFVAFGDSSGNGESLCMSSPEGFCGVMLLTGLKQIEVPYIIMLTNRYCEYDFFSIALAF